MLATFLFAALTLPQDPTDPADYVLPWASSATEIKDVAFSPDGKYFALISPAGACVWNAESSVPGPYTVCYPAGIAWDAKQSKFLINVFPGVYPSGAKVPKSLRFTADEEAQAGFGFALQSNGPSSSPFGLTYGANGRVYAEPIVAGFESQSIDRALISLSPVLVTAAPNKTFWIQESTRGEVTVTEAKGERVKPKWDPKKASLGPHSIQPNLSLLASRDTVINFKNGKPFGEAGVGFLNAFSHDGTTLVSVDVTSKAVNFRDIKAKTVIQVPVPEPANFGRLVPSPDGSYAILADQADSARNIFAQPGGRRAWQVFRSGQVVPLIDLAALQTYEQNVLTYLKDQTRIDKFLKGQTEPEKSAARPDPTARPANYPTVTNMRTLESTLAKWKTEGFSVVQDTTNDGQGRGNRSFSYGPFTINPGNEYRFVGVIDAATAQGRTYVNFHRYKPTSSGRMEHERDYMSESTLVGSAIYNVVSFSVGRNSGDTTYSPMTMLFTATCAGFDPLRVIVLRRRVD